VTTRIQPALAHLAVGLTLVLGVAPGASADYRESNRKGMAAVEHSDWSETRPWMQSAVAENPTESRKKIKLYGTRFVEYLPHFYLGVAQYHLGDCTGALRSFEQSERQGQIQSTGDYKDLQRYRDECRSRAPSRPAASPTARKPPPSATPLPATATPAPSAIPPSPTPRQVVATPTPRGPDPRLVQATGRAEAAIADAGRSETAVRRLAADPALKAAWQRSPTLVQERDQAFGTLEQARQMLASGARSRSLAEIEQASTLAARANQALTGMPARLEALRSSTARTEPPRPSPTARRPEPSPTAMPTVAALPPAGTTVPQSLSEAVEAFLVGEHERVVAVLAEQRFANRTVSAVAHLLRGASYWALYRLGGANDEALREQAEANVRDCRTLDQAVRPDQVAFSPSFVEFFGQTR